MLTVCIPTYNRPAMIARAIESVLNQDFHDYELLIHDNSENTETETVVKKFDDAKIRYHRHKQNIGLAGNWNSFFENARGEYLKFLNDDDWLEPACLSRFVDAIRKSPGVGVVTCRARYVDNSGRLYKEDRITGNGKDYYVNPAVGAMMWLNRALPVRTPTHTMYRRDTAIEIGGFSNRFDYCRDVLLSINLAMQNGAYFIEDKPYVSFLKHPGQDALTVPPSIRIDDQCAINNVIASKLGTDKKAAMDVEAINSSVSLREALIMIKNGRYTGVVGAMKFWLATGKYFSSIAHVVKNDVFLEKRWRDFDRYRTYL